MKDKTPVILVTGAGGQLGSELNQIAADHPHYHFLFTTKDELAITDAAAVKLFFEKNAINVCINCAAYTAVDKAESEQEKAFSANATAVGNLAAICGKHGTRLIHISTDYVFDGYSTIPYKETNKTNPISVYGASKLKGEELALQNDPSAIIIRSSWVYSSYGHNFVKTMLRLMKERESINVVNDQFGCPTYAADLAKAIMVIVDKCLISNELPIAIGTAIGNKQLFNYCNSGATSWFEFAQAIKEITGSKCIINPIPTSQYPTAAKRPPYAVLDNAAIQEAFHISIPGWRESLEKCLTTLVGNG